VNDAPSSPYQNGNTPAPHAERGAFFVPVTEGGAAPGVHSAAETAGALRSAGPPPALANVAPAAERPPAPPLPVQPPTIFPPEITGAGFAGLLYTLGRAHLAAFPLANWMLGGALLASVPLVLQGQLWSSATAAALVAAALLLRILVWRAGRRDGVRFEADPAMLAAVALPSEPLAARDKLPIHATGCFEVGNKVRRFTLLPGYYRSFATREHALLCLCRGGRRLLVGAWPEAEVGLWYAFFRPQAIRRVEAGSLRHGPLLRPALAVEIDAVPTRGRVRRRAVERLYLCAEPATLARIWADLHADGHP
jgi:hypothetical protein